jgi:hypothetical protein
MKFEDWLAAVDALADENGGSFPSYTQMTGVECWREAYDDGLTPDEAWSEEMWAGAT